MRFAGRAFLCRGRGEPVYRRRHVLRAGRVEPRLGLDRCRASGANRLCGRGHRRRRRPGGDACGAKLRGRDVCARCGHFHERHGGVGDLTLRGSGSLTATGSQCGIHVSQALVVDDCTVDARADGAGVVDQTVAGVAAGSLTVRGGGHVTATGTGADAGLRFYGACLLDEGFGADPASETLVVDASWLDATGTDAGVACNRGSLVAAHFVTPAGGFFAAAGVVDAGGAVASHVMIEPDGATVPTGETDTPGSEVPGDGTGEPTGGADPASGRPGTGPATNPAVKPAATSSKTTVTKTTVSKTTKRKSTMATTPALPKTGDGYWITAFLTLFLLGTVLLSAAYRC